MNIIKINAVFLAIVLALLCERILANCTVDELSTLSTYGRNYRIEEQTALISTPTSTLVNVSKIACLSECEDSSWCLSLNLEEFYDTTTCSLFNVNKRVDRITTRKDAQTSYIEKEYPRDCYDVRPRQTGVHQLMLSTGKLIEAICLVAGTAWTLLLKRFDGSVDFYRDWQSYKYGFGCLSGEFWIGLENVYRLTQNGRYRVQFKIVDGNGIPSLAEYDDFRISSENNNYKLVLGTFSGTADDAFSLTKGSGFSTKDRRNDVHHFECAVALRAAGWYKDCIRADIFGQYRPGEQESYDNLRWSNVFEEKHGLSSLEMRVLKME